MPPFSERNNFTATPAASSTSTTIAVAGAPQLGQLLVVTACVLGAAVTFGAPGDNGSGGGWTQIQSTQQLNGTGTNACAAWWKVASAADVSTLSAVTVNYSGAGVTGGLCSYDEFDGFVGTPTLDLSATPVVGSALGTPVITLAATAVSADELALCLVLTSSASAPLGTNQYSPNNGANYYTLAQTAAANQICKRTWAEATSPGASPATWQVSWTASRTFAAYAVTFYDYAPPPPPIISSLTPGSGSTAGGTVVTVNGSGLSSVTRVDFGPASNVPFAINSDTSITVTSPSVSVPGQVFVAVHNAIQGFQYPFTYFQVGVPPPVPPGRGRWRLTLHAREFGPANWEQTIVAELDSARNRKLVQAWNQPATLSFDIDGQSADASLITELSQDVVAWRWDEGSGRDQPMFRGIIDAADDQLDEQSHVVTFTCHDYLAMLGRRLITGPTGIIFGPSDQDSIVTSMLAQATSQARTSSATLFGAAAYLPLSMTPMNGDGSWRAASGQVRTLTLQGNAVIGAELDNLAKLANGFDYDVAPFAQNDALDYLRIFYPAQGVTRTEPPLVFGANVASVQRQLTSADYANYWRTVGNNNSAVQSTAQIYGEAWNADATNLVVGTFMSPDQNADQVDPSLLGGVAAGKLGLYGILVPVYTLALVPGFYSWGLFNMGDTLPLVIQSGRLNVNTTARVLGITYDIGDDGQEDVELIVGRAQTNLATMVDAIAKDVRELSRR